MGHAWSLQNCRNDPWVPWALAGLSTAWPVLGTWYKKTMRWRAAQGGGEGCASSPRRSPRMEEQSYRILSAVFLLCHIPQSQGTLSDAGETQLLRRT